MTDYNNGKIHGWNGGECPVHPETVVRYWMCCGGTNELMAGCFRWEHLSLDTDIIAFQVVEAYAGPKVIWVNEYRTTKSGWDSEADPKQFSGLNKPVDLATILQDDAWSTSVDIAYDALSGNTLGTKATHFHNQKVRPYWVDSMDKLGVYGKHTFYMEENR